MEKPDIENIYSNIFDEIKDKYGYANDIKSFDKEQLISVICALYEDLKNTKREKDTSDEILDLLTSIKTCLDSMSYDITDIRHSTSKNGNDAKLNTKDINLLTTIYRYYNISTDFNHITKRSLFKALREVYDIDTRKDKACPQNYDGIFTLQDWDCFEKIKEYYRLKGINNMSSQSLFYAIKDIYYQDTHKKKADEI